MTVSVTSHSTAQSCTKPLNIELHQVYTSLSHNLCIQKSTKDLRAALAELGSWYCQERKAVTTAKLSAPWASQVLTCYVAKGR